MTTLSPALAANLDALNAPGNIVKSNKTGLGAMDQGDFLKLMVAQLQMQDPFEPVDNKDMLAQMAQFSTLAGSAEGNATLSTISAKLDALIAAQKASNAANPASTPAPTPAV
jgi:flagellar basal-body rod modification protein FlgD